VVRVHSGSLGSLLDSLDHDDACPFSSAPALSVVQDAVVLRQRMAVGAEQSQVGMAIVGAVAVDVIPLQWNSSCPRVPCAPSAECAVFPVVLNPPTLDPPRHSTHLERVHRIEAIFAPQLDSALLQEQTLALVGTVPTIARGKRRTTRRARPRVQGRSCLPRLHPLRQSVGALVLVPIFL
jgi:hypothetical protein